MKTFHWNIPNDDKWALCDTELVIVAPDVDSALKAIANSPYKGYRPTPHDLKELGGGVHVIQYERSE